MHCVVGSGPAGVACATALLERGARVLMLDGGVNLEPERWPLVEKLRGASPEKWTRADLDAYQAGMDPDSEGVPQKLVYGSDFAYREADQHLHVDYSNVGLRPSLAPGGLSNVWGAAMMPYIARDLKNWPFGETVLSRHYPAVLRLTGLAATHDALEKFFPLYTDNLVDLRPSRQAEQLLATLQKHQAVLASRGIYFGRSRVAVGYSTDGGCQYCRLCMYGCPYELIYSSTSTVKKLQQEPNFIYQPGVIVTSVRELADGVEVLGYDRLSRKPLQWTCQKAFLAAGAISTTGILLRSLSAYDQTVSLKDSQYFLLPLLLFRKTSGATKEWLHALSQIFLELSDPGGKDLTTHIQIYSNNDLISQAVAKPFGPFRQPLGFLVRNLQERMLIAQGFLHSDLSSSIAMTLRRDAQGNERLQLRAELNPVAKKAVRKVVARLCKESRHLGAFPLPLMLKIAEPGRSFHAGGTFPMSAHPARFETDLLGRPAGWKRVHAVDATVFPSIPATTITLSVMANAYRIGCEALELQS